MAREFIQETTTTWKTDFRMPCHTYIMEGSKCFGYIKEGSTKIELFSEPWMFFSKKGRSFKKLTKKESAVFS